MKVTKRATIAAIYFVTCIVMLMLVADACAHDRNVNRNLYRIAQCETGGKPGQNGRPDWQHRASAEWSGHYYEGGLGFLDTTWDRFKPEGFPAGANQASAKQQLRVGRILVKRYGGYSSWPACSRRLGLR